ncbi:TPA: hypothetical protein ACPJ12_000999 [Vibrio diabolicus]|uniref:hypothetical protein n=1 Tax=Vibrio sp. HS-50-1 TaxID=2945079 RepID=UPI00215F8B58|nr:hypothetical protein [Vibrio sp. HS-50-1]MCS0206351.1 hypothetical protein [Vibrio sp. HS-50-1]
MTLKINSTPTYYGNWIYIGGDIYNRNWSKVGKTTIGLHTRHTSSQNPGYFIYTAFQIVNGNVHEIEARLLEHLEVIIDLQRLPHFSTGSLSECFHVKPDEMTYLVEQFITDNYSWCVTFENSIHGQMSRYECSYDVRRYIQDNRTSMPVNCSLNRKSYYTGNQEVYEVDLGGGHYLDIASGMIIYREEVEEDDEW